MIVTITPAPIFSQFPPQDRLELTLNHDTLTRNFELTDDSEVIDDNEIRHYVSMVDLGWSGLDRGPIKFRFGSDFFSFIASHLYTSFHPNPEFARYVSPLGPTLDADYFQ